MAKYIDKKDLENKELSTLPIRRGCSGMCACLGICRNIVGYIERDEYDKFINSHISIGDFLNSKCGES